LKRNKSRNAQLDHIRPKEEGSKTDQNPSDCNKKMKYLIFCLAKVWENEENQVEVKNREKD